MLKLNNISLNLGQQQILSDINLNVDKNEIVIMLGSNGSGKSSLLKLIDRRYSLHIRTIGACVVLSVTGSSLKTK